MSYRKVTALEQIWYLLRWGFRNLFRRGGKKDDGA